MAINPATCTLAQLAQLAADIDCVCGADCQTGVVLPCVCGAA